MRLWPDLTVSKEFKELGNEGYSGSLNDRQYKYLKSLNFSGALADMFGQWKAFGPEPLWSPLDLFSAGQQGHWSSGYDPALGRMWQDSAGLTPVTAPGQPVGKVTRAAGTVDASQATALSRPTLARWPKGGRRNLLIWTEDLSNPAWLKNRVAIGATITSPLGSLQKITPNTDNQGHSVYRSAAVSVGDIGIVSCVAKAAEYKFLQVLSGDGWGITTWANFDLENGVVGNMGSGVSQATMTPLGDGFFLCTAAFNFPASSTGAFAQYGPLTGDINARAPSFAGDGVSGIYVGCAQLALGATPAPYQRVTTANDVTEGQNRRNLLTWTEQFDNAAWIKQVDAVVMANAGIAPDGSMTAYRLTFGGSFSNIRQLLSFTAGVGITGSIWIRRESGNANLTLGLSGSYSLEAVTVTNEWVRYNLSATTDGTNFYGLMVQDRNVSGFGSILIWGAQLELGSIATPYQRVTTGYEDFGGVPSVWHLSNDGGDSLPITLPAGTYGRAVVNADGLVTVDTVVDPTDALVSNQQVDVILRQGAFTPEEEANIRTYWARYAA